VPRGSTVTLRVHGSGSDVRVPVTGAVARIPLHANMGLNEYVFEAEVSPPAPTSPAPPLQLVQVNGLTLLK
jgi:hypothetical protein